MWGFFQKELKAFYKQHPKSKVACVQCGISEKWGQKLKRGISQIYGVDLAIIQRILKINE